ncbi:uncharacterized protein LOC121733696 isoform X1 [Aricia agestis]|uniref:uncharacterized protein LOC121733696 isoform X1 n=1 Tax=Aricia agestis TaxID=91739 RepID=UPI001C20857F|nr:uncharacterized protein LOC121733696 isoform X1 [Aricia agestis]
MSTSELIDKLRNENLDQFFTLVRMHLSFVVDINTDDVECSTDKPKQFRWNFHKKTKNSNANSSQNVNNMKKNEEVNSITEEGMLRLYELIEFLSLPDNVIQEGIFRRTGSLSRQQELKNLLITGSNLGLDEGRFTVHDCASVLKGFLAELPQPLLMEQYYQTYCTLASQYPPNLESSETKLLTALQLLLLLLAPSHRNFLERLLRLLRLVADNEPSNRMSPDTLATMFTPHLLCPRKLSPEAFHQESLALAPLMSFMIRQSSALWAAPAQLVTDAAAYLAVRERKKALSPAADLDESYTDRTAANTVYTFVDRSRSVAEHAANPTDTALAQLYAHIHALPPSAHRRRLIKHFNRQNGYGTPIQIQRTGKVAGSKSFGDSIKRHIFNKGLLNKTPKKGSGSSINTVAEKSTKKRYTDDSKVDVSHKNIVLKNLANKMISTESLDDEYDSDASNESTLSEGAISKSKKISPKFVSEPNLSVIDTEETPKKKRGRMFRSKPSGPQINKKYQKRSTVVRGTPTSCVSCINDQDTVSDDDISVERSIENTPRKSKFYAIDPEFKMNYQTSTPGLSEPVFNEECSTPYTINFRRASMSPITKSTQKLSKAMQESIMTPRSRKPLIITSEQRDNTMEASEPQEESLKVDNFQSKSDIYQSKSEVYQSKSDIYQSKSEVYQSKSDIYRSISPKNDSDFVSSDDEMNSRSYSFERSRHASPRINIECTELGRSSSSSDKNFNTTLLAEDIENTQKKSLTEPFREYLLSRSVLTATPIDLSILNQSSETEKISESLLYCLNGNVPSDLTSSISNLAVESIPEIRTPLKDVNVDLSPNRKRSAPSVEVTSKLMKDGEENFKPHETDL